MDEFKTWKSHKGYWRMQNAQGELFGVRIWVEIVVATEFTLPTVVDRHYGTGPNADIYLTFNKDMDASTFTNDTMTVSGASTGGHLCDFSFDHAIHELTIDPRNDFAYGEVVTVTISTGVHDLEDNNLAAPYSFSFTIAFEGYVEKSGDVSGQTWPAGTYLVTGYLYVSSGTTLRLEPGAVVKFEPGTQLAVYGTLDADNTVFTSRDDDATGQRCRDRMVLLHLVIGEGYSSMAQATICMTTRG